LAQLHRRWRGADRSAASHCHRVIGGQVLREPISGPMFATVNGGR
jgi:hypothetical protein